MAKAWLIDEGPYFKGLWLALHTFGPGGTQEWGYTEEERD
jgi:hypothetical protein